MSTPTDATEWFNAEGKITLKTQISWDRAPDGGKYAKMVNVEQYVEDNPCKVSEKYGYNEELYTKNFKDEED